MNFKNNTAAKVSYSAIMYKRIIKIMTHEKKKNLLIFEGKIDDIDKKSSPR